MSIRDCIKLIEGIDPDDAVAVRARVKELVGYGVPANEAWTQAAELVMEDVLAERNEVAAEARELGGYMEDVTIENLLNPKSYAVEPEAPGASLSDFLELGDLQRGKPESAMLKVQEAMGGGVLSPVVEHTGDLTHRMTHMLKWGVDDPFKTGWEFVSDKVAKVLSYLEHPYGFAKEMRENITAAAEYRGRQDWEVDSTVKMALANYAYYHEQLPVYNDAQRNARDAAAAVGRQDWKKAIKHLKELQKHLGTPEEWHKYATENLVITGEDGAAMMQPEPAPEPEAKKPPKPKATPKHRRQVDKWLSKPIRRLQDRVPIQVYDTTSEAPIEVPPGSAGYSYQGVIYLFRDNIRDKAEAIMAIEHEAVGHFGIEGVLGQKKFDEVIGDVMNIMTEILIEPDGNTHAQVREIQAELRKWYKDKEGNYRLSARQEAREIMAHIAHSKPRTGPLREIYNKIVTWVKEWAVGLGLVDPDIAAIERLITNAVDYVTKTGPKVDPNAPTTMTKEEGAALIRKRKPYDRQEELNRQIREENHTIWYTAKNAAKRWFAPGGLLPRIIFDQKIQRDSSIEAGEIDIKAHVWALEHAFKKDFKKMAYNPTAEQEKLIADALIGGPTDQLPQRTSIAIEAMRQQIDGLTKDYIEVIESDLQRLIEGDVVGNETEHLSPEAEAKIELVDTMLSNIGQYLHRSYRAFDDPAWAKNIPSDVLNRARAYLKEQIKKEDTHLTEAELDNEAQNVINEIVKENTAYDGLAGFIHESKLGARDLRILKKRNNEIAPEILALLGEYTDPRLNYSRTVTLMNRLIFNDRFLKTIKEQGMGTIFFEKRGRPAGASALIASEGNNVYSPLNGLYTYPEINQGMIDALGKEEMASWYRFIVQVNGTIKFGKTVLSPTTTARNWMSAMFFAIGNGHNPLRVRKSFAVAGAYFRHQKGNELEYLRKLKELGVVYDTPYAGEMMRLLADSEKLSRWVEGRMTMRHARDFVQKLYQFGDDFWKIVGFEQEVALQEKYYKLSREEAEIKAAERIRNTYPTYSMTGKAITFLRRFPLAGTFVSFPSEIIRTGFNIVQYAGQDLKQDWRLGMRRLGGLATISGAMYVAQEMSKNMLDLDDEEDEAVRDQLPEWSRNSNLYYFSREGGNLRYVDLSFADPYNIWKRPFNAMMRDEPFKQQAVEAGLEVLGPFIGGDIGFGVLMEVYTNKKHSGGLVYNKSDDTQQQAADIFHHIRKAVQPGVFSNIERMRKAQQGIITPSGRKYDMDEEWLALAGFRVSTLDPAYSLRFKGYQARDTVQDASRILSRVARDPNPVTEKELESAFDRSMRVRRDAFQDLLESIQAARRSGVEDKTIITQLKVATIAQRDIRMLLQGKLPPFIPAPQYLRKEMIAQMELKGQAEAELVRERRNQIFKLARKKFAEMRRGQ